MAQKYSYCVACNMIQHETKQHERQRRERMTDDSSSDTESDSDGARGRIKQQPLEITYTQKTRSGQRNTVKLADVDDDFESR